MSVLVLIVEPIHCLVFILKYHFIYERIPKASAYEVYPLVIVITQGQGFMAVNKLSLKVWPKDDICLHRSKSQATLTML